MTDKKLSTYKSILQQYWGYENFRPAQIPVLEYLVEDQSVLAVLPTGGGKSICYQVPALSISGLCIVISPLIALMIDQVNGLVSKNISAAALFGSLSKSEQEEVINKAIHGELKLLYISPERLTSKSFIKALPKIQIDFIAIDEAHCISQWGHDFRPAYRNINSLIDLYPEAQVLAVTATATTTVQDDILKSLNLSNAKRHLQGSRRDNLSYQAIKTENKMGVLQSIVLANEGASGIVYARSRKLVEKLTLFLKKRKLKAVSYHAGLSFEKKTKNQKEWFEGKKDLMVATNAFGMGIDKADVRYVIHFDLPPNLEEYTQEAGRAGRDGAPCEAIILFDENDIESKKKDVEKSYPPVHLIKDVYKSIASQYSLAIGESMGNAQIFHLMDFCQKYGLPVLPSYYALKILDKSGYIMLTDSFYHPSQIKVNKEQLDAFELNQGHDIASELLNKILRIYDGVFYKQVKIDESYLSTKIACTIDETKEALNYLDSNGVLNYQQGGNSPKIKVRGPRRHSDSINISEEIYELRKKSAFEKLEKLNGYLLSSSCRQINIDHYFGFPDTESCQICDICKTNAGSKIDLTLIQNKVIALLEKDITDINELMENFSKEEKTELVGILEKMEANKIISIISNQVILER